MQAEASRTSVTKCTSRALTFIFACIKQRCSGMQRRCRGRKKKVMMSTNKVALRDGGADAGEAVMKARRETDEA